MAENPALFVRVSTPTGHHNMPAAVATRDPSVRVLKQSPFGKDGRLLPPKLRIPKAAATPTPTESEAPAPVESEESE